MALWRLHFKAAGQQIDHPLIQRAVDESIFFQNGENERLRRAILSKYTNHADPDSPQNIEVNWQRLLGDSCSLRPQSKLPSLANAGMSIIFPLFHSPCNALQNEESYGVCQGNEIPYPFGKPFLKMPTLYFWLASTGQKWSED